jgi:hypothetical protein
MPASNSTRFALPPHGISMTILFKGALSEATADRQNARRRAALDGLVSLEGNRR